MLPEELKSGDRLEAGWLNRLVRAIVARTLRAGPGLRLTRTPAGTTIALAPQRRTSVAAAPAEDHWGETRPLVELPADKDGEWKAVKDGDEGEATAVAESHLVDIDVDSDGKVKAKRYRTQTLDANGNVVSISDRSEGAAPNSPDGPPECGNPLNESVTDNPLDDDGEPGGQHGHYGPEGPGGTRVEDNPLDEPGDGGYTPECSQATGEE